MGKPEKHVTIKEETEEIKESPASGGPVLWDAEEDHLLSYFLEGDNATGNAAAAAVAVARSQRSDSDAHTAAPPHGPHGTTPFFQHGTCAPHNSACVAHSHPGAPTTMTPAIHFYAPPSSLSGKVQVPSPNTNTSLSSMASMAAALVGGCGILAASSSSSSSHQGGGIGGGTGEDHEDTISPTASMMTNQSPENLMLPSGPPQTEAEKQQHLLWLQHINAMAQMARQPTVGGMTVAGYPHLYSQPPPQVAAATAPPVVVETEEKRARRLARNRESARQSRRRKKERLTTLEQKVTSLFGNLEQERRRKMMEMEPQMQLTRQEELHKLTTTCDIVNTREQLETFLLETGCHHPVRERVISFQFEKLRQFLLPRHYQFLLWLTLQPDSFFSLKEQQKTSNNNNNKSRISSKQIGEELSQELLKKNTNEGGDCEEKVSLEQIWPLFCFELLLSVDQEERFLLIQKRIRDSPNISQHVAQMALATKMVELTKKGVLFQAHAASMRTHTTLLEILTPEQSVKFLTYMAANRPAARPSSQTTQTQTNDATLEEVCKRLDQVLRLG